jgi:phenylpropionate dioxygenase-like ring-hydroxylating dioxygenase large terminal subunit
MIANVMVRNAWYAAGLSGEFPKGKLAGQVVAEKPIVLWRAEDGAMVAFDDRCCHKRMPLSAGRFLEPDLLECAYHGLCYDKSGQCVRVPSHPDGHIPAGAQLRKLPLIEQDGLVWVWPGDPAQASAVRPPRIPEMADPEWETLDVNGAMHVPANSLLLIENLLDITHFYPLHDGNIGDVENSRIPIEVEEGTGPEGNHFVGTVRTVTGYRQPPYLAEYFGYDVVDRDHTHFMLSPGVTRVQMRVWPEGRRLRHHPHPHADRPAQPCLAPRHQHAEGAALQERSGQALDRPFRRDLPRRHRAGPLGAGEAAGDVRLPRRRLSRGVPEAGHGAAPRPPHPHPARAGGGRGRRRSRRSSSGSGA